MRVHAYARDVIPLFVKCGGISKWGRRVVLASRTLLDPPLKSLPQGPVTRCDDMGQFAAILGFRSIAERRRTSQVSPPKSQQCGQSATHDGMFSLSPAMVIAAMVIRNILN